MAVLGKSEIEKRIVHVDPAERLFITPLLNPEKQIGDAAIDLRLGNEFIVTLQTNLVEIDLARSAELEQNIGRYQELVRVDYGESFLLHPHHLVLGSTLEFVGLPCNVAAQVEGRSSWGRLGLVIATATSVGPGFKGSITLELINLGLVPIALYPGLTIAQLVLQTVEGEPSNYEGRYNSPTGPQFSRIHKDKDARFWTDPNSFKRS
jgi:dCTP deaminase